MQTKVLRSIVGKRSFSLAAKYSAYGNVKDVVMLGKEEVGQSLNANQVLLKVLGAPINPSDFNMIENVYGKKSTLPAVGGNEFVAKVVKIGSSVSTLKESDHVIAGNAGLGTWRQELITDANNLLKISSEIELAYAASLSINPATSYLLLREFVSLKEGDVIIQNGANSMVGVGIVQMARHLGIKTVNIVRADRPNAETTLRMLTNLGGDVNILDCSLNTPLFREIMADLPPCKLALNSVGGDSAVEMARALGPHGTMVTYGGMSKHAPVIPIDIIIEKNLSLKGFWLNKWNELQPVEKRQKVLNDVTDLILAKKLSYFFELHDFDDFEYALKRATKPYNFRKVILNMDYPDRLVEHDQLKERDYEMFKYPLVHH